MSTCTNPETKSHKTDRPQHVHSFTKYTHAVLKKVTQFHFNKKIIISLRCSARIRETPSRHQLS